MSNLIVGSIYETLVPEGFPKGTRVEFIGGPDDDIFTDGFSMEYYDASEVMRSSSQEPLEISAIMQVAKAKAMSGFDPD